MLVVASVGDVGFALVDTNGDGAVLHAVEHERVGDRWFEGGGTSGGGSGLLGRIAYACGESAPGTVVVVEHGGRRREVVTGATGWWAFVAPRASDDDDELSVVRELLPPV